MQCIVLEKPFRWVKKERELPKASSDEALVRVRRVGFCGTDFHAYRGKQPYFNYPRILGHELAVEIIEIKENTKGLQPGDRCVVDPYLACGRCFACRQGKTNCCARLKVLGVHVDGGMQEYMTLPYQHLIRSEKLTLDQLALVENQCIGAHAVRRAGLQKGEQVLVIGAGPIGRGVVQFALILGARVVVLDQSESRLEACGSAYALEQTVHADGCEGERLSAISAGDYFSAVFDATGSPDSMGRALSYTGHGGRLVLVGLAQADLCYFHPDFHQREMNLLSSRNAVREDFEWVMQALEQGTARVESMITHRAGFHEMTEIFEAWLKSGSGVIKAVIEM
jgi:2-desacetyl-2-hydroxyethyl bacteriochlorophyllide A dehydrogenase